MGVKEFALVAVEGNESFGGGDHLLDPVDFFHTLVRSQPSYSSLFLPLSKITFFLTCLPVLVTVAGTSTTASIAFSAGPFFARVRRFSSGLGGTFEGVFRGG